MQEKLKVIAIAQNDKSQEIKSKSKASERFIRQAKFDRLWFINPKQFDPRRNSQERERIKRTWELTTKHVDIRDRRCVDIGCGFGIFSQKLHAAGAQVDALDVCENALKRLREKNIEGIALKLGCMPKSLLQDDDYDLVVSTDVIGFLPPQEHRLYFAELARLVKSDGLVVCSTSLDIDTEGALQKFLALAETEFTIKELCLSHHAFFLRLNNIIKAPHRFAKASKDPEYRQQEVEKRDKLLKKWFYLNSTKSLGSFWAIFRYVSYPLMYLLQEKPYLMLMLEKMCRFMSPDSGVSHVIFIGKRRPLYQASKDEREVHTFKQKKQMWE